MTGRNSLDSNTPLFNDEEAKKLAEFNKFNDFFLSHKSREPIHKEEENRIVLVEPIGGDNCNSGVENSLPTKNNDSSSKQSGSSTSQIYNALHNSSETFDEFPDMETGFSYKGKETADQPMKSEHDIPPGYKRMTIWDPGLQTLYTATVPENTPELTSEEIERYNSFNPI